MSRLSKPLILIFLFLLNTVSYSQDLHIVSKTEKIKINDDTSFETEFTVLFKKIDEARLYPIFYDTELEKVTDIQLFEVKGKRTKPLAIQRIFEEDVKLDYIASKKIKSFLIPANMEVMLKYVISCKELMYFSSLQFFSYEKIDTLKYEIKIPNKFDFVHNTIFKDSLSFFKIDSIKSQEERIWNIKVVPKKVASDPLQFFGIYKNMKVPLMRTLVMPNSYKNQPIKFMNDWYYNHIRGKKGLDASACQKIDELTLNVSDPLKITHIIYNYIKNNFKYVAIEIGMGAFIPSHTNEVFSNKQGDCKDLSNLLSEALRYKGIKSDVALAATFNHITDCDFPSLSSANHVICVAYINGKTILMDPTDPIHIEGTPIQSLQNRTILIINDTGGKFYEVVQFSPEQNEIFYQFDLQMDVDNTTINGTFATIYNGLTANTFKRELKNNNKVDFDTNSKSFYQEVMGNQFVSDLKLTKNDENLQFDGKISINGKTFTDGSNRYLFLDFLPRLIENESRETLIEGTYLKYPFYKKVRAKMKLNEPIEMFQPITHNFQEKGISLNITISANSNIEIQCNYDFKIDYLFIEKDNIFKINEILNSFKKITNDPIVFKKKKS